MSENQFDVTAVPAAKLTPEELAAIKVRAGGYGGVVKALRWTHNQFKGAKPGQFEFTLSHYAGSGADTIVEITETVRRLLGHIEALEGER